MESNNNTKNQHMHRCCMHLAFNRCFFLSIRISSLSFYFLSFALISFVPFLNVHMQKNCFFAPFSLLMLKNIEKQPALRTLFDVHFVHFWFFIAVITKLIRDGYFGQIHVELSVGALIESAW